MIQGDTSGQPMVSAWLHRPIHTCANVCTNVHTHMYTCTCYVNTHVQTTVRREILNSWSDIISFQLKLWKVYTELPEKMYAPFPLSYEETGVSNFHFSHSYVANCLNNQDRSHFLRLGRSLFVLTTCTNHLSLAGTSCFSQSIWFLLSSLEIVSQQVPKADL